MPDKKKIYFCQQSPNPPELRNNLAGAAPASLTETGSKKGAQPARLICPQRRALFTMKKMHHGDERAADI